MRRNYTPEEILEAYERNENFRGTQANMDKIRLYSEIKKDLKAFVERCESAWFTDGFDPNVREKHAILWLDFYPAAILNKDETAALAAIMCKADGTVFAMVENHMRITFDVNNIWNY